MEKLTFVPQPNDHQAVLHLSNKSALEIAHHILDQLLHKEEVKILIEDPRLENLCDQILDWQAQQS